MKMYVQVCDHARVYTQTLLSIIVHGLDLDTAHVDADLHKPVRTKDHADVDILT
jgi:hypothetical protein